MPFSMKLDEKVFTTNRTSKLIKLCNKLTNEGKRKPLIKKKKKERQREKKEADEKLNQRICIKTNKKER